MAWWYNKRKKIKEGRPWIDDNGVKHDWFWIKWSDKEKAFHNLTWEDEDYVRPLIFYAAIGGNITTVDDYIYHEFTGSGTFEVTKTDNRLGTLDYVVIAGGGGSGNNNITGGGSAGNMIAVNAANIDVGKYPIIIGAGGAGSDLVGTTGDSSSAFNTRCTGGVGGGDGKRALSKIGTQWLNGNYYAGSSNINFTNTANTGGGGGGPDLTNGIFNGDSGIVIIRYKYK